MLKIPDFEVVKATLVFRCPICDVETRVKPKEKPQGCTHFIRFDPPKLQAEFLRD